jgi:hypothetical protein
MCAPSWLCVASSNAAKTSSDLLQNSPLEVFAAYRADVTQIKL